MLYFFKIRNLLLRIKTDFYLIFDKILIIINFYELYYRINSKKLHNY